MGLHWLSRMLLGLGPREPMRWANSGFVGVGADASCAPFVRRQIGG